MRCLKNTPIMGSGVVMAALVSVFMSSGCVLEQSGEEFAPEFEEADICAEDTSSKRCLGGNATIFDDSPQAFNFPVPTMARQDRDRFDLGRDVFTINFQDSKFGRDFEGLGPRFNDSSCGGCHQLNGRANPYRFDDQPTPALLIRVSRLDEDGVAHPLKEYGSQLQPFGVDGSDGEVQIFATWQTRLVTLGPRGRDGQVELTWPEFSFFEPAHGRFERGFVYSPRATPTMVGLGLLEAIPSDALLAQADPDDEDGDGISGRPNIEVDAVTGERLVGRFGWKAGHATLTSQNAAAMLGDIGVVSSRMAREDCGVAIPASTCRRGADGELVGQLEIEDHFMEALDFYTRHIAPPASRFGNFGMEDLHQRGEDLFEEAGCASCHTPSWRTAPDAISEALAGQEIWPYTDLLLHDMGEGLADGRPEGEATGREWRTPPLWGIGLAMTVNGHQRFLHDGRARSFEEAILWHGGEAEVSKEAFRTMSSQDRIALIEFLWSL